MAHAYVICGEAEKGVAEASRFSTEGLSVSPADLMVLRHTLFSVEDARKLGEVACAAPLGTHKAIIVSATRFFHEAQNALLKLFEEPPPDTTLVLVVPSEGMLLATLRSRLAPLPGSTDTAALSPLGSEFLAANEEEREKIVAKLVDRSKADKDEEKQRARGEAIALAEDLIRVTEGARTKQKSKAGETELRSFLEDLSAFLPLLYTRSAPLKLIFEHLLIVIPKGLQRAKV